MENRFVGKTLISPFRRGILWLSCSHVPTAPWLRHLGNRMSAKLCAKTLAEIAGLTDIANGGRATLGRSAASWSATEFPAAIRICGTTGSAVLSANKPTAFGLEKAPPSDTSFLASADGGK